MGEPLARDSPTGVGQCAVVFDGVLWRDSSDALSEEDLADRVRSAGGVSASAVIPGGQIPVLDLEDDDAAFRVEEDEIGAESVKVGLDKMAHPGCSSASSQSKTRRSPGVRGVRSRLSSEIGGEQTRGIGVGWRGRGAGRRWAGGPTQGAGRLPRRGPVPSISPRLYRLPLISSSRFSATLASTKRAPCRGT